MATLNSQNIKTTFLPQGNTPKPGIITPKSKDKEKVITEKAEVIPTSFANETAKDPFHD